MTFWAYMLHCNGGYFYTGHTDDLEQRMAEHASGQVPGFVHDHWPAKLVWSADFATRYEALAAERQIKGWSRNKKLALVRGDWERISALARGKKGRPSTGSGRTEGGDIAGSPGPIPPEPVNGRSLSLLPHPQSPSTAITSLHTSLLHVGDDLRVRYVVTGDIGVLAIPTPEDPGRADGLWRHTCFEAFLRHADGDYWEINLSPSRLWAAYRFSGYRAGMEPLEIAVPHLRCTSDPTALRLEAVLRLPRLKQEMRLNLAAVIEETSGRRSYWALAHPPGPPDFHHPDCFVLELPPAPAS
jgi:predicted GIY-YIG superfamily endonuclease